MPYYRNSFYYSRQRWLILSAACIVILALACPARVCVAQMEMPDLSKTDLESDSAGPVELNGDQMEFVRESNTVIAKGHVVITRGKTKLTCDRVEFSRDSKTAIAEGNVILSSPQGRIAGEALTFDFGKMQGSFAGAKINFSPYYGAGKSVAKIADNHIQMKEGYMTTCDLDKPHFKMHTKKIDIYPKDKVVANNVKMFVGKVPVIYIPKYTQRLDDKRPRVIYTPGYDKEWGAFLLTQWRYYLTENVKGTIHLDYRDRKGFAPGLDLKYETPKMGEGIVRLYYMNELNVQRKYFWEDKEGKTRYAERYKGEWRHKWAVDQTTDVTWQYYKLSDASFLKDYYKREYEKDSNPPTYFLLTKTIPSGTLSFRTDARVNHFVTATERLPQIRYDMTNQKIGDTGFYFRSANEFVNLANKYPSPTEVRQETKRLDSDSRLSYPLKISFIEMTPFVGGRQTYYSKTNDRSRYHILRGIFTTGADLSTKFFKIYDTKGDIWGIEVNRLRHIITPSVAYQYTHTPTVPATSLDYFDSVDTLTRSHTILFSLENKLQTKRKDATVDLLRAVVDTTLRLKEDAGKGGFDHYRSDIQFKPADWLTFNSDSDYDVHEEKLSSANFEIYLNDGDKWSLAFGKRYTIDVDDQITTEFNYKINPKWKFKSYGRFDINHGLLKEQEFMVTRDLHCWEMDIAYNETRGAGSEIWLVFRLKAFPDMVLDFSNSFHKRKAGSQSSEGQ
ncbi:MAG TPA: LPS assembly protein LptD [Candidatus Omnitrophota bacterium]|nr:LPS assembly protein LptD [Candidatus Omnitrophota bacterium]HPD84149.1 LPS assembly protein LptD [Candidatus Omnitrophota bacterium]HRZ03006.1 LPS assembly protein LptD [Candidatus Omnitrophota bacterium]